jgi:hypothetical protein
MTKAMNGRTRALALVACCLAATLVAVTAFEPQSAHADPRAEEAVRRAQARLSDSDPDVRLQAVKDIARANNRSGIEAVLPALLAEKDAPAAFEMAEAMAGFTSNEAHQAIERTVLRWRSLEQTFAAFYVFVGLARQQTEGGDRILRQVAESDRRTDYYLRTAALEAIAHTGRSDLADVIVACLKGQDRTWENRNMILALTAVSAAGRVAEGLSKERRFELVLALADVLEEREDDRLIYLTCQALSAITGESPYTDPAYWRFWVQMGGESLERRSGGATTAGRDVPSFFGMPTVGQRVVYVIDISGSMRAPVEVDEALRRPPPQEEESGPTTGRGGRRGDAEEEKRKRIPRPDYSGVQNRMDLAKVELVHAIRHLSSEYSFNVITYDTRHELLDPNQKALIPATEANKQRMIRLVEALQERGATNIHGGLVRGFSIHSRGQLDWNREDPALAEICIQNGATTIFFLTDGFANVTDWSIAQNPPIQGHGENAPRFARSENIVAEARRLNLFRKSVIHTIGIGHHDAQLMRDLASISGGAYVDRTSVRVEHFEDE